MLLLMTGIACLAGMCGYLITAAEMSRHYRGRAAPRHEALRTAVVTSAFFAALGLVLAWVTPRIFS